MEATHHISKVLKVINQTNKLLNKICFSYHLDKCILLMIWGSMIELRTLRQLGVSQPNLKAQGDPVWLLSMAQKLWSTSTPHTPGSVPPYSSPTHIHMDTSVLSTSLPTNLTPISPGSEHVSCTSALEKTK